MNISRKYIVVLLSLFSLVLVACQSDTQSELANSNTAAPATVTPLASTSKTLTNIGDYLELAQPLDIGRKDGKPFVIEFFWFGCSHCNATLGHIINWKKRNAAANIDVDLITMPAAFGGLWDVHAKAYYANEQLNLAKEAYVATYDALHKQRLSLQNAEELADFYSSKYQIDRQDYIDAFNSFAVQSKVRKVGVLMSRAGVNSVPTFIVNGKYIVDAQLAGGTENLFNAIDVLLTMK